MQKTNRSLVKRFKKTARGKIQRRKAYRSHLNTKKSSKRKRRLRKKTLLSPQDRKKILKALHVYS